MIHVPEQVATEKKPPSKAQVDAAVAAWRKTPVVRTIKPEKLADIVFAASR